MSVTISGLCGPSHVMLLFLIFIVFRAGVQFKLLLNLDLELMELSDGQRMAFFSELKHGHQNCRLDIINNMIDINLFHRKLESLILYSSTYI